jgi:hypothetical protein
MDGHQFNSCFSQWLVTTRYGQPVTETLDHNALFIKFAGGLLLPTPQWHGGKIIVEAVMTDALAFPLHEKGRLAVLPTFVCNTQLRFNTQHDRQVLCFRIDYDDGTCGPQKRCE